MAKASLITTLKSKSALSKQPKRPSKRYDNIENLQQRWDDMPSRDRMALLLLATFLVVVLGGIGGYSLHQAAQSQTADYQESISDYFWLRGQAANIDSSAIQGQSKPADTQTLEIEVRQQLQQLGAQNPQVLQNGDSVQLSFTHPNQAIASKIMGDFTSQGLSITRLDMRQNPQDNSVQVQATLSP